MDIMIGNIVSVSDVQKNYRKIFDRAKKTRKPVVVMRGNRPEVAVVDVKTLDGLQRRIKEAELAEALEAIRIGEEEKKMGKLKILRLGELAKLASK